jgi:hypothetical protein
MTRRDLLKTAVAIGASSVLGANASCLGVAGDTSRPPARPLWLDGEENLRPDTHVGFRGVFELKSPARLTLRLLGASWFHAWLDGEFLTEGPARFPASHPEYEQMGREVPAGRHVVSAIVHHYRIDTRLLRGDLAPFFWCSALAGDRELGVRWKATRLDAFKASGVRVSPQFAWVEWLDTRDLPNEWQGISFDDSAWNEPIVQDTKAAAFAPLRIGPVRHWVREPTLIGSGTLTGPFEGPEPPDWPNEGDVSWYKRNLHPPGDPDGIWRRYDLGRVRLGVPRFELDLPAGAVVEFAYSEALHDQPIVDGNLHEVVVDFAEPESTRDPRVVPYIPLSFPVSRNLDHFVARGGVQSFEPLTPRGGRFVEVHVKALPSQVQVRREGFVERGYFDDNPVGRCDCGDPLLDRVWTLGVETLRGCTDDAVTDNPTRERGQWTGDMVVSMYVAAAAYGDLRIFRRAIEQAAYCAREDGLVAALSPGGLQFLSSYAAQWVTSVLNYYELTGDRGLLESMFPYAERNLAAFERALGAAGVSLNLATPFIDWGYSFSDTESDTALNLHVVEAFRNAVRWCDLLGRDASRFRDAGGRLEAIVTAWLERKLEAGDLQSIGYHKLVLAHRAGVLPEVRRRDAREFIKRHLLNSFPNDPGAPRLADPGVANERLITPYFSYYAFPVLIENADMDFVLDQYRACWGWSLGEGLTTQPEVFDLGWSHCHVWASSPTAQLSKYVLGLSPRFDLGGDHYALRLLPGSLRGASGKVPRPGRDDALDVSWKRSAEDGAIAYTVRSPVDLSIHLNDVGEPVRVPAGAETVLSPRVE